MLRSKTWGSTKRRSSNAWRPCSRWGHPSGLGDGGLLKGFTPLHLAVEKNHLQVVQFLIDKGADLDARDVYGRTPLELAEELARDDLEEESAGGANDEASSSEGVSPQITALELFVSQYSRTPRESARRRIQIVKLLREVYAHRKGDSHGRPGKVKR